MIIGLEQYKEKWGIQTDTAIHPGLAAITAALEEIGNPHKVGKFIHLAGTNGKGSTATFLSSILQAHGHSVGNFYSPCIEDLHDQIQLNGDPITADDLDPIMQLLSHVKTPLTDFELLTLAALLIFKKNAPNFSIIEAGMGGALDSTNVIIPEISIIPSISIDHTNFLGDSIEEITRHKAGIIKKWKPVVIGQLPVKSAEIIRQTADELHADVIRPKDLENLSLKLKGPHRLRNASLAMEAAKELLGKDFEEEKAINGLLSANIAYRFEEVYPRVIFDGAHNKASAEALVKTVQEVYPGQSVHVVMGILKDKDYINVLRELEKISDCFTFLDFENDRALPAEKLLTECNIKRKTILKYNDILPVYEKDTVTLVTGSLYLLSLLKNDNYSFFVHYQN